MAKNPLFTEALERKASDIHVVSGLPPMLRIDGLLQPASDKPMSADEVKKMLMGFLTEPQYKQLLAAGDLDCSQQIENGVRLRINCHMVGGQPALAARVIPASIPTPQDIKMPEVVMKLCNARDGLILFTGPTGCGKSTSLASILEDLNAREQLNIITLEDPVEFVFQSKKSLIRQRELGIDFPSFPEGLRHVLRQDPDIVMVGEMRDLESISLALTLAETGHLVLATLHTPNTAQTIDRIVDVFPPHQQNQIRLQLSLSLRAIVAQRLIPAKGGGRVANREILIRTPAVANIIREQRLAELSSVLQTGQEEGMVTFEKDLKRLEKEGVVEGD